MRAVARHRAIQVWCVKCQIQLTDVISNAQRKFLRFRRVSQFINRNVHAVVVFSKRILDPRYSLRHVAPFSAVEVEVIWVMATCPVPPRLCGP